MGRRKLQIKIHLTIVSEQDTIRAKQEAQLTTPLVEKEESEYAIPASIEHQ